MERDKLIARERMESLWRFMQVIEASRHHAERLDALAPRIPEQLRSALLGAAGQLRECAVELHAVWMADEPKKATSSDAVVQDIQLDGAAVRQFG